MFAFACGFYILEHILWVALIKHWILITFIKHWINVYLLNSGIIIKKGVYQKC